MVFHSIQLLDPNLHYHRCSSGHIDDPIINNNWVGLDKNANFLVSDDRCQSNHGFILLSRSEKDWVRDHKKVDCRAGIWGIARSTRDVLVSDCRS